MQTLFSKNTEAFVPLAEMLRPRTLEEVIGQEHLTGASAPLHILLKSEGMISFVLWGPPGTGKTTLARIFANEKDAIFEPFSAVSEGVKRIREIANEAKQKREFQKKRTILFIDEIHRLTKSQQDVLLPYIEHGVFSLIGATTENPSFSLNSALLSRVRVFLLKTIPKDALAKILEKGLVKIEKTMNEKASQFLLEYANGDARILLNLLEATGLHSKEAEISLETLETIAQEKALRYDQSGDEHYQSISAFIKSMRASDPNASIYYLARMLEGGEDPRFIARRMVIFASEDIGLASTEALPMAVATYHASEKIGMPEIRIPLAHTAVFLAQASKNNSAYTAINSAMEEVKNSGNLPIPLHLRNASTDFLKNLGYGKGYAYPHDDPEGAKAVENLPKEIRGKRFLIE